MLLLFRIMWYTCEEGRTHIAGPKQYDVVHFDSYFAFCGVDYFI